MINNLLLFSTVNTNFEYSAGSEDLEEFLRAYQTKKNLSMDEIWNIGVFIQIALIENIRGICEKIYSSQWQKYKVENIIERLVENKENLVFKNIALNIGYTHSEMKYPFIEYMSYRLKQYGKQAYAFLNILEEQVEKLGLDINEVIQKEHFDIALKKVSMGNSITSINTIIPMMAKICNRICHIHASLCFHIKQKLL